MPYSIRRKGNRYEVVNTQTGEGHGLTTKRKAERQLHLLRGIERDWQPTGEHGVYQRKINGKNHRLRVTGGTSATKR